MVSHMQEAPPANKTPLHTALDIIISHTSTTTLEEIVRTSRTAEIGWDRIAASITERTQVPVHGTTLANWFAPD